MTTPRAKRRVPALLSADLRALHFYLAHGPAWGLLYSTRARAKLYDRALIKSAPNFEDGYVITDKGIEALEKAAIK